MSLPGAFLAALLVSGAQAQDPAPTAPPVDLEDITVEGRSTRQAAQQFVQRVAAAPAGARLGRWNTPVCVSVANMKAPYGQMLADRIGDIATELGVSVGAPGCTPNVLVIAADDGPAVASALWKVGAFVSDRPSTTPTWGLRRWNGSRSAMRPCAGGIFHCPYPPIQDNWRLASLERIRRPSPHATSAGCVRRFVTTSARPRS